MNEMDVFHTMVGFMLADLYRASPAHRCLYADSYAARLPPEDAGVPPLRLTNEAICRQALHWLKQEGYVCFGDALAYVSYAVPNAALTRKALRLLALPVEAATPLGKRLIEAVAHGHDEQVRDAVRLVLPPRLEVEEEFVTFAAI